MMTPAPSPTLERLGSVCSLLVTAAASASFVWLFLFSSGWSLWPAASESSTFVSGCPTDQSPRVAGTAVHQPLRLIETSERC